MSFIKLSNTKYMCQSSDDLDNSWPAGTIAILPGVGPGAAALYYKFIDDEWVFQYDQNNAPTSEEILEELRDLLPDGTGQEGKFLRRKTEGAGLEYAASAPGGGVGLGNTSDTAHRGDHGAAAYAHSLSAHEAPGAAAAAQTNAHNYTDEQLATLAASITALLLAKSDEGHGHTAAEISDFQAQVSANSDVAAIKAIIGDGVSDGDGIVNTLGEMLAVFETYSEGVDIAAQLAGKAAGVHTHTIAAITDFVAGVVANAPAETLTTLAALVNGAASKATPVDADTFAGTDSAAGNAIKRFTWANIKATLLAYFNTVYQAALVSGTNIKTINGSSLLGAGDLSITAASEFTGKLRSSAGVTNATTTPANVPGCVFTFEANSVYVIDLYLLCTSVAATTGYGFAFDTSVAVTENALTFTHQLAAAGTITGGDAIADNASRGLSSGVPTAATNTLVLGKGLIITGANPGTAQLMFRPEVAASATCKQNSVMRVMKIA
jgi:hypothetical protein